MNGNRYSRNYDESVIILQKDWKNQLDGVSRILDLIEEMRNCGSDKFADDLEDCMYLLLYE